MAVYTGIQHPRALDNQALETMMQRRTQTHAEMCKLASGERSFTMTIPVQDDDTDMVISASLDDLDRAIQEIYRLRGQLKRLYIEYEHTPDVKDIINGILFGTGDDIANELTASGEG